MTSRRGFLTGLTGFVACAPAIVRASSLMPVKVLDADWQIYWPIPGKPYAIGPSLLSAAHIRRAQEALNRNFRLMLEDPAPRFYGHLAERVPLL